MKQNNRKNQRKKQKSNDCHSDRYYENDYDCDIVYLDDDDEYDSLADDDIIIEETSDFKQGTPPQKPTRSRKKGSQANRKKETPARKNQKNKSGAPVKKAAKLTATAAKTTGKAAFRAIGFVLRFSTWALILYILYLLFTDFWAGKNAYGDLTLMLYERNYTLAAYCASALLILLYEFISLLWSFSGAKVREDNHYRTYDSGRGGFSFILIYLGAYVSSLAAGMIPASPSFLQGISGALTIYGSLSTVLLPLCIAGLICSVLRKFAFH